MYTQTPGADQLAPLDVPGASRSRPRLVEVPQQLALFDALDAPQITTPRPTLTVVREPELDRPYRHLRAVPNAPRKMHSREIERRIRAHPHLDEIDKRILCAVIAAMDWDTHRAEADRAWIAKQARVSPVTVRRRLNGDRRTGHVGLLDGFDWIDRERRYEDTGYGRREIRPIYYLNAEALRDVKPRHARCKPVGPDAATIDALADDAMRSGRTGTLHIQREEPACQTASRRDELRPETIFAPPILVTLAHELRQLEHDERFNIRFSPFTFLQQRRWRKSRKAIADRRAARLFEARFNDAITEHRRARRAGPVPDGGSPAETAPNWLTEGSGRTVAAAHDNGSPGPSALSGLTEGEGRSVTAIHAGRVRDSRPDSAEHGPVIA